jgi:alanine racemase
MARRPVWAEVDLGHVQHNAAWLAQLVAPAKLCAVVKAYGYGHGPVRAAEAAVTGGAAWLAVATVEEGVQLPTIYTPEAVAAAARAVEAYGGDPLPVHIKIDTGMHRVGAAPRQAIDLARAAAASPALHLEGLATHFAVADEPEDGYTLEQLSRFQAVVDALAAGGVRPPILHAANSAGAIAFPEARLGMVRCGIALYGLTPSAQLAPECKALRPAMSVKARVLFVKEVDAGERISYGLRYRLDRRSTIATVPIGYADGVPRRLADIGAQVLIGGKRRPIAGTVTMDQITVDCGDDVVRPGDEVVLIGCQGTEEITAWEWAEPLGTIAYEVVCGISARVPRDYRVRLDGC